MSYLHYQRLAFTRQEAEAILGLKASPSDLRALDFDANAGTAVSRLNGYRIVHFSVHAYTGDSEHPERRIGLSSVNAAGEKQDGI